MENQPTPSTSYHNENAEPSNNSGKKIVFSVQAYKGNYDPQTRLSTNSVQLTITETAEQERHIIPHVVINSSSPVSIEIGNTSGGIQNAAHHGNVEGMQRSAPIFIKREPTEEMQEIRTQEPYYFAGPSTSTRMEIDEVKTGAIRKEPYIMGAPKPMRNLEDLGLGLDEDMRMTSSYFGQMYGMCQNNNQPNYGPPHSYAYQEDPRMMPGRLRFKKQITSPEDVDEAFYEREEDYDLELKRKHMDYKEYMPAAMVRKLYPYDDDDEEEEANPDVASLNIRSSSPEYPSWKKPKQDETNQELPPNNPQDIAGPSFEMFNFDEQEMYVLDRIKKEEAANEAVVKPVEVDNVKKQATTSRETPYPPERLFKAFCGPNDISDEETMCSYCGRTSSKCTLQRMDKINE